VICRQPALVPDMKLEIQSAARKLRTYCQSHNWAGHDPYDALNSRAFRALPFLDHKIPRLILIQALKRSPLDVRRLLLVPKKHNAKATALFLSALLRLGEAGEDTRRDVELMIERLRELRSPGKPYWCWGYSFPWQTRTIIVPDTEPNLVCTVFAARALLEAHRKLGSQECLNMAVSSAEYVLNELYWRDGDAVGGFSYPLPGIRENVPNANFLASALLCKIYAQTGDKKFLGPALEVTRRTAGKQAADGSWPYAYSAKALWIDNFHTGYNLCALRSIARSVGTAEFDASIKRGFIFYRRHFFHDDGMPKYFYNRTYPVDIHCVAQSIITLLEFRDFGHDNFELANSVLRWAMTHMWDDRGFFYYRMLRLLTIRISYMRWSQAWMLLAMAAFLNVSNVSGIQGSERS